MEERIMIAPVGENMDALFVGMRDYPVTKVILLTSKKLKNLAEKAEKDLKKFAIPVKIIEIVGNEWEGIFEKVSKITNSEKEHEVIINTSSGDRNTQCAMTSAAFVNGLKAFAVMENETMLLPILKFSYYKTLTDKKLDILKILYNDKKGFNSLEELSKKAKMSPPLISYHINGTLKSEGLKSLGLVEVTNSKGKIKLAISVLGKLLIKGQIN
ncbi:hypothetical protein HN992_00365 [Candidatus Woesearchaeota archaeon]|jgi:hypothetical protein|nr:hypothetical protein [Candidatus Woesearchaeota archaeon]MBT3438567.1 hypothetical protein [Candidatus Woesearchaeota archaeon]MBT4058311.1 hypothetical protein [Candidatus Woesearchaeota archaeon]MBT4208034.1 hypothetical protein [Candidatus Woesearchaeota archaeon]MBT4732014.1 hypothetical protein [Candidatus Woesearchaeota archaeon]